MVAPVVAAVPVGPVGRVALVGPAETVAVVDAPVRPATLVAAAATPVATWAPVVAEVVAVVVPAVTAAPVVVEQADGPSRSCMLAADRSPTPATLRRGWQSEPPVQVVHLSSPGRPELPRRRTTFS